MANIQRIVTGHYSLEVSERAQGVLDISISAIPAQSIAAVNITLDTAGSLGQAASREMGVSCKEAARLCGYKSVKSIYRLIKNGALPFSRVGKSGNYLIQEKDLKRLAGPEQRDDGATLDDFIEGKVKV